MGILLSSQLQFSHTSLYKKGLAFLLGQAATMHDKHSFLYALLALVCLVWVFLSYKELQAWYFDPIFSKQAGIRGKWVDRGVFILLLITVVLGIRGVGLLLMSGMFVGPAIAARQFSNKLTTLLVLSTFLGALSALIGTYISLSSWYFQQGGGSFPTGPLMVLSSCFLAFFSLLFSPQKGYFFRVFRINYFRYQCIQENICKHLYTGQSKRSSFSEICQYHGVSPIFLYGILFILRKKNELLKDNQGYALSSIGAKRARHIIRLHRLWEVYLHRQLGMGERLIHHNAEQMEHILTPELEAKLTQLLDDPKFDPHQSPIPPREELR